MFSVTQHGFRPYIGNLISFWPLLRSQKDCRKALVKHLDNYNIVVLQRWYRGKLIAVRLITFPNSVFYPAEQRVIKRIKKSITKRNHIGVSWKIIILIADLLAAFFVFKNLFLSSSSCHSMTNWSFLNIQTRKVWQK